METRTEDTVTEATPLELHEKKEMKLLEDIKNMYSKETIMETPSIENVFKPGNGQVDGLGMGGGALGLVALLALLNRNGIGVGGVDAGGGGVNQITLGQIQTALGDLKAAVPLVEGQIQLALAGAQADVNRNISSGNTALMQGQSQLQLQQATLSANLGDKIDQGFTTAALATAQAQFATVQAINNDGDKTRALIQSIDKQNDSRLITSQANEITELRQDQRRLADRHGIEISMTNNQNQNQLQFQQQAQVLNTLSAGLLDAVQNIRATNQAINIGSGVQQANPHNNNTNTNVRA